MTDLLAGRTVTLVHEWVGAVGGAEYVFRVLADLLPHAEKLVLWADPDADPTGARETWLARTPLRNSKALALPLMPLVWRTSGRPEPDVVLSSSHAFAHTVKLGDPARTRHLSYVHSPARYVWSPEFDGRGANPALKLPRHLLQRVDLRGGRHVHAYAANSVEVQRRIKRFWHRDATVIYPPVDVDYYAAGPPVPRQDYLLGVGRFIAYKNFGLMIELARTAGMPLVLAGTGPMEAELRAQAAGLPVTFEIRPDRARLRELYAGARALLFPAHEDFGIIPVEAQACGTPVLGPARGGLLETVVDGETGFLSTDGDYLSLIKRLDELDADRCRRNAARFRIARFAEHLTGWVHDATR